MRISDWSSDVCSSDLIKQRDHRAATNFRIMPASRIRGRPAGTLPLLEALQLHALIKWNNRVDLALRVPVAVTAEHALSSSSLKVLASLLFMYTAVMLNWKVSGAASRIRLRR